MKISEKCRKDIEDLIEVRNKLRNDGFSPPYEVVMWNIDFDNISELYLAYKDSISEKIAIQADFEESEDRCATLEAENENFREHLNALEAENKKLRAQINRQYEKYNDKINELHTIKKSFEVLRALYLGDYENDEPF